MEIREHNPENLLDRFEQALRTGDEPAAAELKKGLAGILQEKKAPAIQSKAELPCILIATPEVTALPAYMGDLSQVITTGDGGGLADISSAVIAELARQGVNVHVTLPHYEHLFKDLGNIEGDEYQAILKAVHDEGRVHLVSSGLFRDAKSVYGEKRLPEHNTLKAVAFSKGIIYQVIDQVLADHKTVLVHSNDWMTGLVPAGISVRGNGKRKVKSLMTFHNLFTAYQTPFELEKDGVNIRGYEHKIMFKQHPDSLKHDLRRHWNENQVDFLATGLHAADFINTVSPTFLEEIVQGDFGFLKDLTRMLRSTIQRRAQEGCAHGITNAPMDGADPLRDPHLIANYGPANHEQGKRQNKSLFVEQMGLASGPEALVYWPHRLSDPQKGVRLMLSAADALLPKEKIKFAVVANGDPALETYCIFFRYLCFDGRNRRGVSMVLGTRVPYLKFSLVFPLGW